MMKYAIAVLRHATPPDIRCLELPVYYQNKKAIAAPRPSIFTSLSEAHRVRKELNKRPYLTTNDEFMRPEYYVINHVTADYITSGRFGNDNNYQWNNCLCNKADGSPCRECVICMQFRILADRQFIIANKELEEEAIFTK